MKGLDALFEEVLLCVAGQCQGELEAGAGRWQQTTSKRKLSLGCLRNPGGVCPWC